MRISWSIHLYPPKHNAGSEWMAHNINKFLVSKGHEVRVILHQAHLYKIKTPYIIDGVEVTGPTHSMDQYQWPDVIITHLGYTSHTLPLAYMARRPSVHFVHNDSVYQSVTSAKECNIVYNSQWIADKLAYRWPSMVFTPYCDYDHITSGSDDKSQRKYITLMNLNENKGGRIFEEIARQMPDRKFLAVKGAYDPQIIPNLPNVTVIENQRDVREVYKLSRLVLMPSKYESWGLCATEAMACGIPVICTQTPGLFENCSTAGNYIADRDNIESWIHKINLFDNEEFYNTCADNGRLRARQICDPNNLIKLENFLINAKQNFRHRSNTVG